MEGSLVFLRWELREAEERRTPTDISRPTRLRAAARDAERGGAEFGELDEDEEEDADVDFGASEKGGFSFSFCFGFEWVPERLFIDCLLEIEAIGFGARGIVAHRRPEKCKVNTNFKRTNFPMLPMMTRVLCTTG